MDFRPIIHSLRTISAVWRTPGGGRFLGNAHGFYTGATPIKAGQGGVRRRAYEEISTLILVAHFSPASFC